jgi:hypothetical protein
MVPGNLLGRMNVMRNSVLRSRSSAQTSASTVGTPISHAHQMCSIDNENKYVFYALNTTEILVPLLIYRLINLQDLSVPSDEYMRDRHRSAFSLRMHSQSPSFADDVARASLAAERNMAPHPRSHALGLPHSHAHSHPQGSQPPPLSSLSQHSHTLSPASQSTQSSAQVRTSTHTSFQKDGWMLARTITYTDVVTLYSSDNTKRELTASNMVRLILFAVCIGVCGCAHTPVYTHRHAYRNLLLRPPMAPHSQQVHNSPHTNTQV